MQGQQIYHSHITGLPTGQTAQVVYKSIAPYENPYSNMRPPVVFRKHTQSMWATVPPGKSKPE